MRLFLPALVLFLLCACEPAEPAADRDVELLPTPTDETVAMSVPDSLLRHAVLFSFKEDSYPDGVKAVEEAFLALPEKIDVIRDFEWGTNNSPEGLDRGFTHLFFVTFASEADRAAYLPHPDHQAFVDVLRPHLKEVLVLDYWTK